MVGASERGWTKLIVDNIRHFNPAISLFPINPKNATVWGERCYPSFGALPEPIDLALMIIPAAGVPASLSAGIECGLKSAIVYAAGFGEGTDPDGAARADELRALAARGLRMCGPNGMGTISIREGLYFYPAIRIRDVRPGSVGLIMHSGGVYQYWLEQAAVRGLGFTYAVSSGNELDLDLADYLNFMIDDPHTKMICCLIEAIRRPAAFMAAAARALEAGKPILCVKIGRSAAAQAAAKSHTGALAGDDRVFNAVCERFGIVRCVSLDDMIESALAFHAGRTPSTTRIAMVGYSGASRGLALDAGDVEGVDFAELLPETVARLQLYMDKGYSTDNPMDLGGGLVTDPERYGTICRLIAADDNVGILAIQAQLPVDNKAQDAEWLAKVVASTEKPILAYSRLAQNVLEPSRVFQERGGARFLQGIPETMRASRHLIDYARRAAAPPSGSRAQTASVSGDVESLLRARGVTAPKSRLATSSAEAAQLAGEIGLPVALKLHSPRPIHKTEVGGVVLDLQTPQAVEEAAVKLFAIAAAHPELACDGLMVQEMIRGLEMIVGARMDAQFGPCVIVGLGGTTVEALDDIALRLLPVDRADVARMIAELRGRVLLDGFRGAPPLDVAALAHAVVRVGELFLEHDPPLADIEINPLVVLTNGRGVRAVDIRVVALEATSHAE